MDVLNARNVKIANSVRIHVLMTMKLEIQYVRK